MSCTKDIYKTFYEADKKIWHGRLAKEMYGPEAAIGAVALQCLLQDPDHINQDIWNTFYDADKKIWHGPLAEELYGPKASIGAVVLQILLEEPDHISQICFPNGKKYTNLQIAQWSVSVAEHFKSLNVEQCDVIGLNVSNTDYLAPLFLGALLAGLTLSTLDPSFDKDGIKHMYSITKPKHMFCDGKMYDKVKEALSEINLDIPIYTMKDHKDGVPTINEFLNRSVDPRTYRPEALKLGRHQTAIIMCSSGTTGKPKGVCTSHSVLLNSCITELDSSDILLNFSNLYWVSGLWCLLIGTMKGATRIISDRPYSPEDFFEIVQKYKVTFLFTPPSIMAMTLSSPKINEYDLSSIVGYYCGGSAVPPALVQKIKPHIPNAKIITAYGMTETGMAIATGDSSPDGSVGKLTTNLTAKIINDDGQNLGPLETGEICVKTLYPWAGYYGNKMSETTKEIYKDGWIHSGDIGYFNEDGRLFIIDRKKDILKYNGYQFFPNEIEEIINQLPGIAEVCVCGIPDIVSTFLPAAAIVRAMGSSLTEQEVYEYVAKNMEYFKHLHGGVYFLDSMPKTVSGKNLRRAVVETLEKLRNAKN